MKSIPVLLLVIVLASGSAAAQNQPVQVVVTSPRGQTSTIDQSQQIVATFNQPMTALEEVPSDKATGPMVIQPAPQGKYRWLGTATIAFIPAKALPYATLYSVTIPAGTKSVSGQILNQPFTWQFETPRPRVVSTNPFNRQQFIELDHSILITFNQPVDPQQVSRAISIEQRVAGTVSYLPYKASRPSGPGVSHPEQSVLLIPNEHFSKGALVNVLLKAGLQGSEGPVGMTADYLFTFSTYGEFTCSGVQNTPGFDPRSSLHINFSNPVSQREVVQHLSFAPPVAIEAEAYYEYASSEMSFSVPLKAEQEYVMTISEGLKDRFGNSLTGPRSFKFRTGSFRPYVHMTTGQGILEAYESHKYPVKFMNVDSVTLQMAQVSPDKIVEVMQRLNYSYYERLAWEQAILEWVTTKGEAPNLFRVSRVWKSSAKRNEEALRPVNLDEVLGTARTGVVLLQVDHLQEQNRHQYLKALLQVTHMGITSKFSPTDNLFWITTLKDAAPVEGATVEVRSDSNKVLWTGTTDRDGFIKSPGWGKLGLREQGSEDEEEYYGGSRQPRLWVIVKKGNDIAFSCSDWNNGIEPYTFNINYEWNPKFEPVEGSIFTDRGLYKAGEEVEIKSIARVRHDGSWRIPPKGVPLKFVVRNPRNEEILSTEPVLSPFGSFAKSLLLKPDASLGYYSMMLQMKETRNGKEQWTTVGSASFRVEAFRAAEFDVSGRIEQKTYILGDDVAGSFTARYLFGGPMSREPITWRITATPTSWAPPGFEGYWFGPLGWLSRYSYGSKVLSSEEDTLDEKGMLNVRTQLHVGELTGPQVLQIEGDVSSKSRQVISGRASVLIQGAEFAIGISPSSTFIKKDSLLTYKLVAATPDGKLVSDQSLSVKVVQRIWRSVRVAETGGRYRWESSSKDSVVAEKTVQSMSSPVEQSFAPKEAGFYYLSVTGKDKRGNVAAAETYFYVSGSDYVAWERSDDDRIELVASKTEFKPGDVASIIVKSPYERAVAMISLEREGIIRHYRTLLVGSAPQIDIPVLKEYLPNVFVSVVLLQGRVEGAAITKEADVGRPSFKIGYLNLSVSPKEKMLAMSVNTDRKEYRPGDTVRVSLKVNTADGKGAKAEVALSVADLGVLNLIGYRMPNVFDQFYRQRGLAVTTSETRIHLVQQRDYGEKGEDDGGGGGEGEEAGLEGLRKDFRPSAYWNPAILTDAQGNATVKFVLPDNLTTFQIMAVGGTVESDFGYAEQSFLVNKPLLLQASLPRFARVGDSFEGGVVIINSTDQEKQVTLVSSVSGIAFTGKDTVSYVLKPRESREVRHHLVAEKTGTAAFMFRASTATDRDGLLWKIPINLPRLRESVALYESVADRQVQEKVAVPADIFHDLGEMQFTLASTAMVGLSGGISYLFEYPYGCLEQRLSRVLPMILAEDLVKAFNFEVLKDKDYKTVVTGILDEVPLFQRDDGGFAYWKNTDDTWPYLSAYAMFALVKAKQAGYAVNDRVLENGFQYLRHALAREVRWYWMSQYYWDCTDAIALYTLALADKPDHGYMQRLYTRKDSIPLFAKAYLIKALSKAKGYPAMIDELARDLANRAKFSQTSAHFEERDDFGGSWCWNSNARTTALVMQALTETQPENNIIPKVVRWLIDQQKVGRWRTTQENLYVIDAFATYLRVYESDEPNFRAEVKLAGGALMNQLFKGRSFNTVSKSLSLSELTLGAEYPIDISKQGPGRLYYTIRMNYYPKGETKAKDEGYSITKVIEPIRGTAPGEHRFKAGTIAKVTLTISTNQERNFVVVEDPVPAGFEIINTSFQTTAQNLPEEEQKPEEWWEYNPFRHRELYDDHALFFADYLPASVHTLTYLVRATSYGAFAMPATHIEGMYEPEVFGQTASHVITIE